MNIVRQIACSTLEKRLRNHLAAFPEDEWPASALVVAPHPDDEVLGCGGVAAKKIAAGSDIHFVFVTDGTGSHPAVDAAALGARRRDEALEAVARLGAGRQDVSFLEIPDGRAAKHVPEIVAALGPLLDEYAPESVFVPHAGETPPDHRASLVAVRRALADRGVPVTIFEYPIWYWYHWPWVGFGGDLPGMWRTTLQQTVRTGGGLRALRALNTRAYVGDVLPQKQAALAAHLSQTQRSEGAEHWPILADLARRDFLARLLSEYETFNRYRFPMAPRERREKFR